jgi:hypothetical protein
MSRVIIAAAHTPAIEYIAAWATFGTALGTVGLAIATFALALKTRALAKSGQQTADAAEKELVLLRDQADASKRQSEPAEAALTAFVAPQLLDIPLHTMFRLPTNSLERLRDRSAIGPPAPSEIDLSVISADDSPDATTLVVPVRNVGAGVALGLAAAVRVARDTAIGEPVVRGEPPSAIAVGDHGHVWFGGPDERLSEQATVIGDPEQREHLRHLFALGEDLVLEIAYAEVSGRREVATSLYLTKSGRIDRAYRVTRVVPRHQRRFTAN